MQPDDTVRIPLRARDGSVRAYALVDAADADFVNQWRWCLSNKGYAKSRPRINGHVVELRLHRVLLGLTPGDGFEGDHINRDRLDCRRENLRTMPMGAGVQNRDSFRGSTSAHRGVSWNKAMKKWIVQVCINRKITRIGYFTDEQAAAEAARSARARMLPYSTD